ncbi:MAG: hypothetical protein LBM25_01355 [Bacteroidales bacterium]|jgi:hypothetical protein|nr:hypothetical protein [Bacteroidales bacterium]
MKKIFELVIIAIASMVLFFGCKADKETEYYPSKIEGYVLDQANQKAISNIEILGTFYFGEGLFSGSVDFKVFSDAKGLYKIDLMESYMDKDITHLEFRAIGNDKYSFEEKKTFSYYGENLERPQTIPINIYGVANGVAN